MATAMYRRPTLTVLPEEDDTTLTDRDVSAILHVSERQVQYLRQRGELAHIQISARRYLYLAGDVRAFLRAKTISPRQA